MSERVVFACSGGLDTAATVARITERTGAEVVAVAIDLGRGEHPETLGRHALDAGAVAAVVVDARDEFADRYCLPALQANALDPSVAALSRPLVVEHLVEAAARHGATTVAHGRDDDHDHFKTCLDALAPHLTAIGPFGGHGARTSPNRACRNVWGRAARSAEPRDPEELTVTFDGGVPVALDGDTVTVRQAIHDLDLRTGGHGALVLITAHRDLEDHTLDRDLARLKRRVERRWGALVRDGRWHSPLKHALDGFIQNTQRHVSGEVRLVLHGGRAAVAGRRRHDFDLRRAANGI